MAGFGSFKKYIGIKGSSTAAKNRASAAEVKPADFAHLIISMSRLLNQLDAQPALAKEKLGAAEWVSLTLLSEAGKLSDKQLGKTLGLPGRRVREIIGSLQRAGRISYSAPAAGGVRSIELTEAGSTSLAKANGELLSSLQTILKGRERVLASVNKQVRLLMRVTGRTKPQ
jgi:hypothetical protein